MGTNVTFTAITGSVKNVFTGDVDLVLIKNVPYSSSGDSVTLTDVKRIYWAVPCLLASAGTSDDVYAGTALCDYSDDPGRIDLYCVGGSAGTANILAVIERVRS